MSYLDLKQNGLAIDYFQLKDGSFVEVWELRGSIYHSIWGPGSTSELPLTINKL